MSRIYIVIAIVGALCGLTWLHEQHSAATIDAAVSAERTRIEEVARDRLVEANKRAMDTETQAAINDMEVQRDMQELAERARADAVRAADELGRLRGALAIYRRSGGQAGPSSSPIGRPDEAGTLADALGQCSERYAGVASVADELSIQVTGLQRYITEVAGPVCVAGIAPSYKSD